MNLSRCKRRSLVDLYYFYPHKKNIQHAIGTVPFPFIKQAECTDNKLSADWLEWREVVEAYIEKLKIYLEDGNSVELGSRTGEFRLSKFKASHFTDFKKSKEQGKQIAFRHNNVDSYFICTSWCRKKVHLKMKSYWKIKLNRKWLRRMYLACEKDYTKIYKIRSQ